MARAMALGMAINSYRDLEVWNLGMDLVDQVIARRKNRRQAYQNHVSIAMGSQGELDTELEVALRAGWFQRDACAGTVALCRRVGLLLTRLHDSLD